MWYYVYGGGGVKCLPCDLSVFPDSRRDSSRTPEPGSDPEPEFIQFSNSESEPEELQSGLRSVVSIGHNEANRYVNKQDTDIILNTSGNAAINNTGEINNIPPVPATTTVNAEPTIEPASESLPADILAAIGNPKRKEEVFGPKVPEEIAKRWGGILVDGLTKEDKQELQDKMHIPENFRMIKSPLLNPEISAVLGDSVRNRDKLLEKSQNHLGMGIAGLTNLASTLAAGNMDRLDIIKKVSEINMIFLDLHFEHTKTRRKLVMSSLDKKFTSTVSNAKRDTFLFGADLGEKIKALKTAEKSGLQIKRSDGPSTSNNSKRFPSHSQGNWKGPPRQQTAKTHRQGGQRSRYQPAPQPRRPPPTNKFPAAAKTSANSRKLQ